MSLKSTPWKCRPSPSTPIPSPTPSSSSLFRAAPTTTAPSGPTPTGSGKRRPGYGTRTSGCGATAASSGARCLKRRHCRAPGRSTSATPRPQPTRAGKGNGFRPRRSGTAPLTGRLAARSAPIPGATRRRLPSAATSTARAGTRRQWMRTRLAQAPSASSTCSATAGSGPPPSSRRCPVSSRSRSIPATLPTSSTANIYVLKGGSAATAAPLLRRAFRNWFQPHYPYVYATFRLVEG